METRSTDTKNRGLKILSWQVQPLTWDDFLKEVGPNQIWEAKNGPELAGHYLHTTTESNTYPLWMTHIDITRALWLPQVDYSLSDDDHHAYRLIQLYFVFIGYKTYILITACVVESRGPFMRVK